MIHVATHLYRRLMRRGRVLGLVALSAIPAVVFAVAASGTRPGEDVESTYVNVLTGAGYTFAIAALVIAGATLREERDGGTLPYIFMRPYSRLRLAIASIGAGAVAAITIGAIAWLLAVLAGFLIGAGLSITGPGIVMFLAASLGYASVFVPLGYLASRSLLIGLGYVLVVETILAFVIPGLAQISIWRISMSIYGAFQDVATDAPEALGPIAVGAGGGLAKLAAVLVVGVTILTWALRRRDAL